MEAEVEEGETVASMDGPSEEGAKDGTAASMLGLLQGDVVMAEELAWAMGGMVSCAG